MRTDQCPDPQMLAAFRELAPRLGFTLSPTSFEVGEHSDIGLFLIAFARSVAEFGSVIPLDGDIQTDNEQIYACIRGFEALLPEQYANQFEDYANDPYLVLLGEQVSVVSSDYFENFRGFDLAHHDEPHREPRAVVVSDLNVVHIGGSRAVATYTLAEDYTHKGQDKTRRANALALLAKLEAGWRILLASDPCYEFNAGGESDGDEPDD